LVEVKASESYADYDSDPELERGRQIIDVEPSATVATTKLHLGEPDEPKEREHLFHSQMWVKGSPLHFIIDSGSQKNLISTEVIQRLALPTTPHPQLYTIGWIRQGSGLRVSQQCRLSYDINPFNSRPRSVIITLNGKLYRIPEVVPASAISFISTKKCRKVISQTGKVFFFMIFSQNKQKIRATSKVFVADLSTQ
jgi:hypothetical protein